MISRRRFLVRAATGLMAGPALVRAAEDGNGSDPPRLDPLLVDVAGRPITTVDRWEKKRQRILGEWAGRFGAYHNGQPGPPKWEVLEEETLADGIVRTRIAYESEPGFATEAYLLRPAKLDKLSPGAVVFHSTVQHSIRQPSGVEGVSEKQFGLKLARRGFVVLCPRNYLWTDSHTLPPFSELGPRTRKVLDQLGHPKSTGIAKMLFDAQQAVDILVAQPNVDRNRLTAIGHSLGAKVVFYLAAFDRRIGTTVSSEGGIGTRLSNWEAPWYLGPAVSELPPGVEQHELLAAVAPRPFLLVGGDSADGEKSRPFIERAREVYRLYGKPGQVELLNHHKGHALPPVAEENLYDWIDRYGSSSSAKSDG
jgi:dienelactone hydrolase